MPMILSDAARSAMCDALVDLIDVGTTNPGGLLRVYTGDQPAGPGSSATGTLLAEFDLEDPAFTGAVAGAADADLPDPTTGLDDGTAGWYRVLDRDETAIYDRGVGDAGVQFNTTTISTGVPVEITAWTVVVPSGA